MANLKYIGKNILNHDLILKKGDVSGSNASTGSFGNLNISSNASITGDMVVGGTLTAQEIHTEIESASIIFTSGSTKFGDTSDDTHEFTGSILVKGNLTAENLTADSSSFSTRVTNLVSDSASFSTRITTAETELEETIISASAQLAEEISGSFTAPSASFATRITNLVSDSASFSTRITTAETELELTLISGSAQIATQISGAFDTVSSSLSSRLQTAETELENTLISGSAQLASQISGAFTQGFEFNGTISGSATSTGSFGRLETAGKISGSSLSVANDIEVTTHKIKSTQVGTMGLGTLNPVGRGLTISPDGTLSGTSLGQLYGLGITHGGSSAGYYALRITTGQGSIFSVQNNGSVGIGNTNTTHKLDVSGTSRFTDDVTLGADISGSATSTGSFGLVLQNGNELSTFLGAAGTETLFSGSAASTGSFGHGNFDGNVGIGTKSPSKKLEVFKESEPRIRVTSGNSGNPAYEWAVNNDRKWVFYSAQHLGTNTMYFKTNTTNIMALKQDGDVGIGNDNPSFKLDVGGTGRFTGTLTTAAITTTGITSTGNISGSATSTASFGHFIGDGSGLENVFEGTAPSASISTRLTNLKTDSGSFSTRITNLKTDSGSFSTRITNLKADSGSFSTRVTKNEGTGSKILNGQLEFTNITGSGHISMSLSSTGSFGRVSVTTLGGHSPIVIDGETTFVNSITSSAHVSSSMTSTASFGRVNVLELGGHQSLTIDPITTFTSVITASSAVQFDGKVFIETGSIEGDLHVRTNENLMRIGKSTSGLIVSGSEQVSRFATGSDGSIIDLGFTLTDEDGNVVLAGDGDGIHIDSNNYWYNNKYYKIGDGVDKFLTFDNVDLKYKGQVFASTGSFDGEMFIKSPTGSMFIGKFTGGIPSSGSDNVSRFATGSDGSIIDLGFTTTDESGETVFLTTGDGIVVDEENYWYTTGHFKLGNGSKKIEWNTTDLNISASTVDVTTLKATDVNFAGLPTSDPLVTGSLWVSGSATSGSFKSGYVMISGIHG